MSFLSKDAGRFVRPPSVGVLATASLIFLLGAPVNAQQATKIFVSPGRTQTLRLSLTIDPASVDDGADAQLTIIVPDSIASHFSMTPAAPVTIAAGQSQTLSVTYTFDSTTPEGSYNATARIFVSNVLVDGGQASLDTSVNLTTTRLDFSTRTA